MGNYFSILVFYHFFADWMFQSHKEAFEKSKNWKVRFYHCYKYTLFFVPLFYLYQFAGAYAYLSLLVLFVSHFIIDSYIPVILWAKYCRKYPGFEGKSLEDGFKELISTPLGIILMIVMDQFFHICFLLPVAYWLSL
jgi:hypothetical protein